MEYKNVIEALDYSLQLHIVETDRYIGFKTYIVNNDSEINSLHVINCFSRWRKNETKTSVSM